MGNTTSIQIQHHMFSMQSKSFWTYYIENQTKNRMFESFWYSNMQLPTCDLFHLPMSGTVLISLLGIMKVLLILTEAASSSGTDPG